jgi:hypothetical protein
MDDKPVYRPSLASVVLSAAMWVVIIGGLLWVLGIR